MEKYLVLYLNKYFVTEYKSGEVVSKFIITSLFIKNEKLWNSLNT